MTYNPRSANPFAVNDPNKEWTTNSLILQDPALRAKSGAGVLDANVSELYGGQNGGGQVGGGAVGAPFHLQYPESSKARAWKHPPYYGPLNQNQVEHEQEQKMREQLGGMQMAYHYFNDNKRW